MAWTPIVGKAFKISEIESYLSSLDFSSWKANKIVWHNTGLPTIQQWEQTAQRDLKLGLIPGQTRINNLTAYYRDQNGWSSGPHWFVYKDLIWAFTPSNRKGTHSPSWNATGIGIEMIADFDKEDDETGAGLLIKKNTIALTAMLCDRLSIDPQIGDVITKKPLRTTGHIFLHKQDPLTKHDCPGKNIAKDHEEMVQSVLEYMGHAGEHVDSPNPTRLGYVNTPNDTLNLRDISSASGRILTQLKDKTKIQILNEGMNGSTKWFYIDFNTLKGWVAARYIKET
jgi:hypothetical protein